MNLSEIPDREYNVAKQLDSYVNQYGDKNPMWIAELSNGETIYQDDGRPNAVPESAWARLKIYCENKGLHVTNLKIKNRSNAKDVPANKDGYFFCKCASAFMFGGETLHSFIVGYLDNGRLFVRKWSMPEMTLERVEERDPFANPDCLIAKDGALNGQLQTQNDGSAV